MENSLWELVSYDLQMLYCSTNQVDTVSCLNYRRVVLVNVSQIIRNREHWKFRTNFELVKLNQGMFLLWSTFFGIINLEFKLESNVVAFLTKIVSQWQYSLGLSCEV